MIALHRMYHPLTATPFQQDASYREVAPCAALAPYIRCFWGSEGPVMRTGGGLVIPDTCMDVIFRIGGPEGISTTFCTLDEQAALIPGGPPQMAETFAIRFYPWSVPCFTSRPLRGCGNGRYPAEMFFPALVQALAPRLAEPAPLETRIRLAEAALLAILRPARADAEVLSALHHLLKTCGRARIPEVSAAQALSTRQLERRFETALGLSPKAMASLMRYQLLWQAMVHQPGLDVQDAVARFGYGDQAHLLHDFRRRHLMTPREALAHLRQDVAF